MKKIFSYLTLIFLMFSFKVFAVAEPMGVKINLTVNYKYLNSESVIKNELYFKLDEWIMLSNIDQTSVRSSPNKPSIKNKRQSIVLAKIEKVDANSSKLRLLFLDLATGSNFIYEPMLVLSDHKKVEQQFSKDQRNIKISALITSPQP